MRNALIALLCSTFAVAALAKLPPPSDEAKAKAAEAAAKAAHGGKAEAYLLCRSMERVAARYATEATKAGKTFKPTETPACADPGAFVPAGAASAAPAATASAPAKKT